ncbi:MULTISPECIES: hypothetical protein [Cysteiniphilum]|uniref:hypothetical protein n=1 Tax=Cysteiniphilum TaxID=2056696 RepID=UPI00177E5644|nr:MULTISPECIES: hypothetical protein [Cysteiniphilum]
MLCNGSNNCCYRLIWFICVLFSLFSTVQLGVASDYGVFYFNYTGYNEEVKTLKVRFMPYDYTRVKYKEGDKDIEVEFEKEVESSSYNASNEFFEFEPYVKAIKLGELKPSSLDTSVKRKWGINDGNTTFGTGLPERYYYIMKGTLTFIVNNDKQYKLDNIILLKKAGPTSALMGGDSCKYIPKDKGAITSNVIACATTTGEMVYLRTGSSDIRTLEVDFNNKMVPGISLYSVGLGRVSLGSCAMKAGSALVLRCPKDQPYSRHILVRFSNIYQSCRINIPEGSMIPDSDSIDCDAGIDYVYYDHKIVFLCIDSAGNKCPLIKPDLLNGIDPLSFKYIY